MRWTTGPTHEKLSATDQQLLAAARAGDVTLVQECLASGTAKVDCRDHDTGWMPLHLACAGRHEAVATVLLDAQANPDLICKANGLTPLSILIQSQTSTTNNNNPTTTAAATTAAATAQPDPTASPRSQRRFLRKQEQTVVRMAETLLRYGADPSGCTDIQTEASPLHMAAAQGRLELVQLLIEYGALMIHGQQHALMTTTTTTTSSLNKLDETKKSFDKNSNNHNTKYKTLTPLSMACRAGHVSVMDYLLAALPPQTLQSSAVLQQALQEARAARNVDCLVGLWEYAQDVLWLDHGAGRTRSGQCTTTSLPSGSSSIDPARQASLAQAFFDIFQESSSTTNNSNNNGHAPEQEDLHASFRQGGSESVTMDYAAASNSHNNNNMNFSSSEEEIDVQKAASWWEILQEACRRRSVNLMYSLMQRLPYQDILFAEIQQHHPSMQAALLQGVDRHDHQTLLHRFCAANHVQEDDTNGNENGNSQDDPAAVTNDNNNNNHEHDVAIDRVLTWIQRLLFLSRSTCPNEMEAWRLADLAMSGGASASPHSSSRNLLHNSFKAMYESDSKFDLESDEFSSEEEDDDDDDDDSSSNDDSSSGSSSSGGSLAQEGEEESDSGSQENEAESGRSEEQEYTDTYYDDEEEEEDVNLDHETVRAATERAALDHLESENGQEVNSDDDTVRAATERGGADRLGPDNGEDSSISLRDCSGGGAEEEESDSASYSIESETESESEDGFRSTNSIEDDSRYEDLNASFVAVPSHSGKDLINAADKNLQTALHIACARGFVQAIELLLKEENIHVNAQDIQGNTPLMVTRRSDVISVLMLDPRTDLNVTNADGLTRLHLAIQQGDMIMVQLLLHKGASPEAPDAQGRTPLYLACSEGNTEISVYLLAHGADPNAPAVEQNDTPLHAACEGGHLGVILRLFAANVDAVNSHGRTPLHVACFFGHLDVVEYLVTERRASLNTQDNDGLAPFELACQAGSVSVVYYLVRNHTSSMWDRTSQASLLSDAYVRPTSSLEEEFSCSYSHITTDFGSSCYSKEDPFSFSVPYSTVSGKEDYQTSPYTPYTLPTTSRHESEPYYSPLSCDSSPCGDEPFVFSSRYRRSLCEEEPIYY